MVHHFQVFTRCCLAELGEDVDGAEGVVGPKADGEQKEDKEGLLGGSLVSLCIGKVRLVP